MTQKIRKRGSWADHLLLLALIGVVLLFVVWPVLAITLHSFQDRGGFTLSYYQELLNDRNRVMLWNSLWTAGLSALISVFFAVVLSLYTFISHRRTKYLLERACMIAMISPPFVSSLAYITLFGRRGLITYGWLGLHFTPYGPHGIVLLESMGGIAFASLLLLSNLDQIDAYQLLASRDLGAKAGTTLRTVVFPKLLPGILSAYFLLFTMNLSDFSTPIAIGGDFKVLAEEAYLQAISTPFLGKAAAISVALVPVSIIASYFYRMNMKNRDTSTVRSGSFFDSNYRMEARPLLRGLLFLPVLFYFAVVILKYGTIFLSAFSNTARGYIQWTAEYIQDLPPTFFQSLFHSLIFSALAGLISSSIGFTISYYNDRRGQRGMNLVEFFANLPYLIPGIFFGLGYVAAFSGPPLMLRGTAVILIANYVFRQLTVPVKNANAGFKALSPKLDQAARDLGATQLQLLRTVLLPPLMPHFISSFITVFTSSMSSMGAIAFLVSPGMNVGSMEIFNAVIMGSYGVASLEAVILMFAIAIVNLLAFGVLQASRRKRRRKG